MKRSPLTRHKPMSRVGPRGLAKKARMAILRVLLWARCRGRCERCGRPMSSMRAMDPHHVEASGGRGEKMDRLDNLMGLHRRCHAYLHEHPAESRERGWIHG